MLRTLADLPQATIPMLVAEPVDVHLRLDAERFPVSQAIGSNALRNGRPPASIPLYGALDRYTKTSDRFGFQRWSIAESWID